MTDDLTALRSLAEAATPGPWHFHQDDGTALDISEVCIPRPEEDVDLSIASLLDDRDGAFIAAANPQVILELIERLRETERLRAHWREKCTDALIKRDAALARIADLEAELEVAMRPHSECERSGAEAGERIVDLEGDLARVEARITEAAKLHQPEVIGVHEGQGAEVWCPHCETYWPCQTAVALGLNEGDER